MPVDPAILIAFLIAASVIIVSPGPDTVLIIRYTMTSGGRVGMVAMAGVQLGLAIHTIAAAAGLTIIVAASPVLFKGVAIVGGAYIAFLGYQALRAGGGGLGLTGDGPPVGIHKAWRDAVMSNVFNPKVILLFLALMPGFVVVEKGDTAAQLAVLGAAYIAINIVWQIAIVAAAEKARRWLVTPSVARGISIVTGIILIVLAAGMIWTHAI